MNRRQQLRSCPTWGLRLILANPLMRSWRDDVLAELHERLVAEVTAETADEGDGPWLVSPILGVN